jgi:hypothetical protein
VVDGPFLQNAQRGSAVRATRVVKDDHRLSFGPRGLGIGHDPFLSESVIEMLWADELLETQRQVQVDLAASADLFVQRTRKGVMI